MPHLCPLLMKQLIWKSTVQFSVSVRVGDQSQSFFTARIQFSVILFGLFLHLLTFVFCVCAHPESIGSARNNKFCFAWHSPTGAAASATRPFCMRRRIHPMAFPRLRVCSALKPMPDSTAFAVWLHPPRLCLASPTVFVYLKMHQMATTPCQQIVQL